MPKSILTYCYTCNGDKNHKTLFAKSVKATLEHYSEEFHVVECLGCTTVSFLRVVSSEDKSEEPIHYNYPHSFLDFSDYAFLSDEDQEMLPKFVYELYEEVRNAFKSDSAILAGIGLRTLVEAVCLDQSISGNNLQRKIEGLNRQGLISTSELPILDKLRLIGNFAAHRIKSLSMDKLEYALGIVNHVLRSIYVLPKLNI